MHTPTLTQTRKKGVFKEKQYTGMIVLAHTVLLFCNHYEWEEKVSSSSSSFQIALDTGGGEGEVISPSPLFLRMQGEVSQILVERGGGRGEQGGLKMRGGSRFKNLCKVVGTS